jgi:hypothetical protein
MLFLPTKASLIPPKDSLTHQNTDQMQADGHDPESEPSEQLKVAPRFRVAG